MYTEDTSLLITDAKALHNFTKSVYKSEFVPETTDEFLKHLTRQTESKELCYFDNYQNTSAVVFFYKHGVTIPDSCVENLKWGGPLAKEMANLEYWKMLIENIAPYDYEELPDLKITLDSLSDHTILKCAEYIAKESDDTKKSAMRQAMSTYLGGYNRLSSLVQNKYQAYANADADNCK